MTSSFRLSGILASTALATVLVLSPAHAAAPIACDPSVPGWIDFPETSQNECDLNALAPAAGDDGGEDAAPEEPAAEDEGTEEADQPDELNEPEPTPPEEPKEEEPKEEEPVDEEPVDEERNDECDGPCSEEPPEEYNSRARIDLPTLDQVVLG